MAYEILGLMFLTFVVLCLVCNVLIGVFAIILLCIVGTILMVIGVLINCFKSKEKRK